MVVKSAAIDNLHWSTPGVSNMATFDRSNSGDQGSVYSIMQGYREGDGRSKFRSPLSARYSTKEMSYNWSEMKKFSTWRRLWICLAKAEKVGSVDAIISTA